VIVFMFLVWAAERYGLLAGLRRYWVRKKPDRAAE
jgi:hypothetical protein